MKNGMERERTALWEAFDVAGAQSAPVSGDPSSGCAGQEEVFRSLSSLGITRDGCCVVHSSLRHIGPFSGGAVGLLDALTAYLCDGLLIVPTHTWRNVNENAPEFDVRSTPPCIGTFPTICAQEAMRRKNAVRSLHPTHSVAAFGKEAKTYVLGELETTTRTPLFGVWGRLYEKNAKILLLGVGLESNTYLHVVDDEFNGVPDGPGDSFDAVVIDENGVRHSVPNMHKNGYWRSFRFPEIEDYFCANGAIRYGTLGMARVTCFDVRAGHDAMIALCRMAKDPYSFDSLAEASRRFMEENKNAR